ncbi:hypothetical protein F4774DRAFT_376067 [Daldinia eschscholtzii]|nr:hypothetical protein F4774DRAFT_376067 [Daldinia eschscholtzii]
MLHTPPFLPRCTAMYGQGGFASPFLVLDFWAAYISPSQGNNFLNSSHSFSPSSYVFLTLHSLFNILTPPVFLLLITHSLLLSSRLLDRSFL